MVPDERQSSLDFRALSTSLATFVNGGYSSKIVSDVRNSSSEAEVSLLRGELAVKFAA